MELVLPMYNVHTYFSLKNLGKKCTLYTAKYGTYLPRRRQTPGPWPSAPSTTAASLIKNW